MRVLVHGGTLEPEDRRLSLAALGLALRGHDVSWIGASPARPGQAPEVGDWRWPETPAPRWRAGLSGFRHSVDVVIGGGRSPGRTARAGWVTGAHALVLGLDSNRARRWGAWSRWCWESLDTVGLLDREDLGRWREEPLAIDARRLAAWSGEPPAPEPRAEHPDTEILERACERSLARRRGGPPRRAVFLDRDGTLVVDKGYLARAEDIEVLGGVARALRCLAAAGVSLVVISNQSGVGRGLFPLGAVYATTARLRNALRAHGVELDAAYFCPHRPEAGCPCRKPGVALLEQAAENLGLSLRHSAMIGDKLIDVAAGHNAGALGVLVRTGYGREEEARLPTPELERAPDRVCDDLEQAARWLVERLESLVD